MLGGRQAGASFRRKRFQRVCELISGIVDRNGSCRILDIGGVQKYWTQNVAALGNLPISITIVNIEEEPKPTDDPRFSYVTGDARNLSDFGDNSFDLVHSNSVIEHVGRWTDMQAMAREARRLAPVYYVQTPSFWFPIEPHFRTAFFHWLPEQLRMRLVLRRRLGFYSRAITADEAMNHVQSAACIDCRQLSGLFPDAAIERERFLGLTKSLMAVRVLD